MDLRTLGVSAGQLARARELAFRRLLSYQPFIFSDDLEVGVGLEFAGGEGAGMVYCKDSARPGGFEVPDHFIDPVRKPEFTSSNARLRVFYNHLIDAALAHLPPPGGMTAAEVGCATGYFLLQLAERGIKQAVGYDNEDYGECIVLLNEITKLNVEFRHTGWDAQTRTLSGSEPADLVLSIAVLCHLSEPLQHLAFLGRMARKALLVWAPTIPGEPRMMLDFVHANRYYINREFPYNFDFVSISTPLLKQAMEWMGFRVYTLPNCPGGMSDGFFNSHAALLGVRP